MIRGLLERPAPVVRMGREKKILLGFLGLLAGVFVGVLSMKLLVPRPPTGAGPDIRSAVATAQERVQPPAPSPAAWDFAAAPPLVPDQPAPTVEPTAPPNEPDRFAGWSPPQSIDQTAAVDAPAGGDVRPTAWEQPEPPPVDAAIAPPPRFAAAPPERFPTPAADEPATPAANDLPTRDPFVTPTTAVRPVSVAGEYLVAAGDSWWGVAERAYGDGRLYRALFAWNRAHDPRVSLAPGTRLQVPPLERLQAAWPRLLPTTGAR